MMPKGRTIKVIHPAHGVYTAEGVKDKYEAVIRAAKSWGEQWSTVAKNVEYEEVPA